MSDPITRLNAALEGRYRIERELGEGGMATVYLAEDVKHNRKVALKVLKPELAAVVGAERFLAEIKTTANLQHPHILPLFDSGEADGFLFYVMPFVEGETLRDRIDREKQLPVDEAVALASKVAGALQHAHEHGVIHRDIKPGNILLQGGEPVVADLRRSLEAISDCNDDGRHHVRRRRPTVGGLGIVQLRRFVWVGGTILSRATTERPDPPKRPVGAIRRWGDRSRQCGDQRPVPAASAPPRRTRLPSDTWDRSRLQSGHLPGWTVRCLQEPIGLTGGLACGRTPNRTYLR